MIDEADQVDSVLGMAKDLLRDRLADVACSDNDGVLDETPAAARKRTRSSATEGHEHRREGPEQEQLLHGGMGDSAKPGDGEEDPRADRHHVEDVCDLVGGDVIRSPIVLAVQTVQASDDRPTGKRRQEQQGLGPDRECAGR